MKMWVILLKLHEKFAENAMENENCNHYLNNQSKSITPLRK